MERIVPVSSFPDLRLAQVCAREGRSLPCWTASGAIYHIAFHLADSVPQTELAAWRELREGIAARCRRERRAPTEDEQALLHECHSARVEKFLAAGHGACLLRDPSAAGAVADVLRQGNGDRYALHVYTLMPNHLHVVAGGFASDADFHRVLGTWKSASAHRINRLLGRTGEVWMRDAYTHIIRNETEYRTQLSYVWNNPETAGLATGFRREKFVEWR